MLYFNGRGLSPPLPPKVYKYATKHMGLVLTHCNTHLETNARKTNRAGSHVLVAHGKRCRFLLSLEFWYFLLFVEN